MTAIQARVADLPDLAAHPSVTVVQNMTWELGGCEVCVHHQFAADDDTPAPDGRYRITWRFGPGKGEHSTDVCSVVCAEEELASLIGWKGTCDITLHVPSTLRVLPSGPLLSPARTQPSSAVAEEVLSALHGIRNTARTGEGHDDVETFRRAAIAAVSRIDTERRAA